jgi:hypothetical protein
VSSGVIFREKIDHVLDMVGWGSTTSPTQHKLSLEITSMASTETKQQLLTTQAPFYSWKNRGGVTGFFSLAR